MTRRLTAVSGWTLAALLCLWRGAAGAVEDSGGEVITQIGQLAGPLKARTRQVIQAQITGTAYGVDRVHKGIVLTDDTGWLWLDTESVPENVGPGSRVRIEGGMTVGCDRAFLGKTAIVEGESYTDVTEQSGRLYLRPGKHGLNLEFHQSTQRSQLDVYYEGPGFSRMKIPDSALWHPDTNNPGQFLPGLECEGYRWSRARYPDYQSITQDWSGLATNFVSKLTDRKVKSDRKSGFNVNYVLRFTGNVEISRPGYYQFNILADDGARLTFDDAPQYRMEVVGQTNLADAVRARPGQVWEGPADWIWAEFDGTVRQAGTGDGFIQLELDGETGSMQVRIADDHPYTWTMLLNNQIRVCGLAQSTTTYYGSKTVGRLLVPGMEHVTLLNAAEANWQMYPQSPVRTLGNNLDKTPARVRGTITEVAPGKKVMVQDETGKVEAYTSLARGEDKGKTVEVLGWVGRDGSEIVLRPSAYRQPSVIESDGEPVPLLTSIEQIRRLDSAEAAKGRPVRFRGMAMNVFSGGVRAHIRGESEGIYIFNEAGGGSALKPGDLYEIEGRTAWRAGIPMVEFTRATSCGPGQWPQPVRPTWGELMNGSLELQWVEVQGVVLEVAPSASTLVLGMPDGEIGVHANENDVAIWRLLGNAVVRVRGVVNSYFKNQHVEGAVIQVPSPHYVTIVTPPPQNLFSITTKRVSEVQRFDANAAAFPFVKVAGQIVHIRGTTCYLMDGTNGLRFTMHQKVNVASGDMVEAVGLPETDCAFPCLKHTYVKTIRNAPLPAPIPVSTTLVNAGPYESTRVQLEATLLNTSTNQSDQVLELQAGTRTIQAKLDLRRGQFPAVLPQSRVRVTGVFTTQNTTSGARASGSSMELLMSSPADLLVLHSPSWWSLRHSLMVLGAMTLALILAFSWITALRRRVEQRTLELRGEIAGHHRTEAQLQEKTALLQAEIEERKRMEIEVEHIHRELVDASRQAGQAEVAASVLHNVGNVLNSVNVSNNLISQKVRRLPLGNLHKAVALMQEHAADLGRFLATDEKGRRLPQYLAQLAQFFNQEQESLLTELHSLGGNLEHIEEIVAMQQAYAKRFGLLERAAVPELVENALKLHAAAYVRHGISLQREFEPVPEIVVDKHKMLQILVNLLQNAKYACSDGGRPDKQVVVRIRQSAPDRVRVEIADNGTGIAPENMPRLFTHGFTTRKNGHGFGLHSSVLAAKEMKATLTAHSEGPGKGAAFTLELPIQSPQEEAPRAVPHSEDPVESVP